MSYLKDKRVYISGSIEMDKSLINWREPLKENLINKYGLIPFDPNADIKQAWGPELKKAKEIENWDKVCEISRRFVRKDLQEVDRCDFLIARVRHDIVTYGTTHEIINAWNSKKIVLLFNETSKKNIGAWFFGFIPHKYMFGSIEDMYKYLDNVDSGNEIEDFRWSYIYGLI